MMLSPALIFLAIAALAAGAPAAAPAAPYCSKAPYKAFLIFSSYQPAQQFCAAKFPIAPATVTVTVPAAARMAVRSPVTPAPKVKNAVTPCTGNCAAWSSLSKVGGSIVKSACGCIQTQSTVTETVTASPPPFCRNPKSEMLTLPCPNINGGNAQWAQAPAYRGAVLVFDPSSPDIRPSGPDFCSFAVYCANALSNYPAFGLYLSTARQAWYCQGAQSTSFSQNDCNVEKAYAFSKNNF